MNRKPHWFQSMGDLYFDFLLVAAEIKMTLFYKMTFFLILNF